MIVPPYLGVVLDGVVLGGLDVALVGGNVVPVVDVVDVDGVLQDARTMAAAAKTPTANHNLFLIALPS